MVVRETARNADRRQSANRKERRQGIPVNREGEAWHV
jgi:hypothetical protein